MRSLARSLTRRVRRGVSAGLPTGWTRGDTLPLALALVVDALGSGLFLPFSVLFFTATTTLSLPQVGLGLSLASALRLPLGPALGALVDRVGPRRVLLLSNIAQGAGMAGYLLVDRLGTLVLAAFVVQLGNSAFWASYAPLVTRISAPGERERWFGLLGALRNTGFAAGALLAGVAVALGGTTGYRAVTAGNAVSYLLAGLLLLRVRVPAAPSASRPRPDSPWRVVLADRPYLGLALTNVAYATAALSLTVAMPVYAVQRLGLPGWLPGTAFTVNCVLVALAQAPVVAALSGRTRVAALRLSAALAAVGAGTMLAAAVAPERLAVALVLLAVLAYTGGELIDSPVLAALSSEAAPDDLRGRYLSVYQLSWNVASTLAPALLTALLAAGPAPLWGALVGVAVLAGTAMTALARRMPAARLHVGDEGTESPVTPLLDETAQALAG